jgi:hypothetical protein
MSILEICERLEATFIGTLVRESAYGFPIVVALHILGLTLSVGTLLWFDLRLLGVSMRGCRVSDVYRRLAPWLLSGFALMFSTGAILFTAYATSAYGNLYFRIKVAAMVLAGVNALVYHFTSERAIAGWDEAVRPPLPARIAGLTSIVVWTVVILAGRMMSYTMFSAPQ